MMQDIDRYIEIRSVSGYLIGRVFTAPWREDDDKYSFDFSYKCRDHKYRISDESMNNMIDILKLFIKSIKIRKEKIRKKNYYYFIDRTRDILISVFRGFFKKYKLESIKSEILYDTMYVSIAELAFMMDMIDREEKLVLFFYADEAIAPEFIDDVSAMELMEFISDAREA